MAPDSRPETDPLTVHVRPGRRRGSSRRKPPRKIARKRPLCAEGKWSPPGGDLPQKCDGARNDLIGIIIVGHLIGGPSLHVLAGVWATIEERPRHRTKTAQTKKEKPQPDGWPGLRWLTVPIGAHPFRPNAQRESTSARPPHYEGIAFCDTQCRGGPGGKLGPTTGACAPGSHRRWSRGPLNAPRPGDLGTCRG